MSLEVQARAGATQARAGYIAVGRHHLFAWHHPAAPECRRGAAVVLCPPLGFEYVAAYRAWRMLAEALAARGFDVLRFDYEGTGNSTGNHEEPCRMETWLESIAAVVDHGRAIAGTTRIGLVGLRVGAMLALQAAARIGVDRLALWSPFASGRACVRELRAFARLSRQDHASDEADAAYLNAAGYAIASQTTEDLGQWTVESIRSRPAADVLIVDRDDRPHDALLADHLGRVGASVTSLRPQGTAALLAAPHLATVPENILQAIVDWFDGWSPAADGSYRSRSVAGTLARSLRPSAAGSRASYEEQPVRFGAGDRLFGMLSTAARQTNRPGILLLNTGAEHHIGPHRLYVPLAREWAARGHDVLRYDLGGIGDSLAPEGSRANVAYPEHMLDDAREAMGFMRRFSRCERVLSIGLCSGGWLSFRAACEGLPLDAVVCVNPPLYLLSDGPDSEWFADASERRRYKESLRTPTAWRKALLGRASYAAFTRLAAGAVRHRVATRIASITGNAPLVRDLDAIAARGVRTLFVFSRGDQGLEYFNRHAGPALKRPHVAARIQHVVVDGAGHSFRPLHAQLTLCQLLTDFVEQLSDSAAMPAAGAR